MEDKGDYKGLPEHKVQMAKPPSVLGVDEHTLKAVARDIEQYPRGREEFQQATRRAMHEHHPVILEYVEALSQTWTHPDLYIRGALAGYHVLMHVEQNRGMEVTADDVSAIAETRTQRMQLFGVNGAMEMYKGITEDSPEYTRTFDVASKQMFLDPIAQNNFVLGAMDVAQLFYEKGKARHIEAMLENKPTGLANESRN